MGTTRVLTAGVSLRRYDNDRSFAVERDDFRAFLSGRISESYRWAISYRRVEFVEDTIESFDADLVEVSLGMTW